MYMFPPGPPAPPPNPPGPGPNPPRFPLGPNIPPCGGCIIFRGGLRTPPIRKGSSGKSGCRSLMPSGWWNIRSGCMPPAGPIAPMGPGPKGPKLPRPPPWKIALLGPIKLP